MFFFVFLKKLYIQKPKNEPKQSREHSSISWTPWCANMQTSSLLTWSTRSWSQGLGLLKINMAMGQNLRYLFGDDYPPKVVYFKGFWDVHRGTGVLLPYVFSSWKQTSTIRFTNTYPLPFLPQQVWHHVAAAGYPWRILTYIPYIYIYMLIVIFRPTTATPKTPTAIWFVSQVTEKPHCSRVLG